MRWCGAAYFFLPPLHLPKPERPIGCGADVYSPALLPMTGSPMTTSQALDFAWPLRWHGFCSNPIVCSAVLPPLSAWPFGRSAVWAWRSTMPQPKPAPGNAPEHCSRAPSLAPPPAVPETSGSSPGRTIDLLL